MYNLYQSKLRKDIQAKVYQKTNFSVNLFGKKYFGLIKEKKIWPLDLKRYQVMWVELPDDEDLIKEEIKKIKTEFSGDKKAMFFQWWILNEIINFENMSHRSKEFTQDMKQMRLNIRKYMKNTYQLKLTIRENMPQCNIIYDINKTDEQLIKEMNSGCKGRVKKAIKNNIEFRVADPSEYTEFYIRRKELASHKGFNIITKEDYDRLTQYILDNKCGDIFISHKDGELVAGSVCLYDDHRLIYLYWFGNSANKKFRNLWWHHFLKFKIFAHARSRGMSYVDMMWGAPTGFPDHPLAGVTKFKESLWGMKIEQYGSYDIILNKFLYKLYGTYLKCKKKS